MARTGPPGGEEKTPQPPEGDLWRDLGTYKCETCRFYVSKGFSADGILRFTGRCRRHAPTMDGYPVVYPGDWCGDHKLGTNPSREADGE